MACAYFVHKHPHPDFSLFSSLIVHSMLLNYTDIKNVEKGMYSPG